MAGTGLMMKILTSSLLFVGMLGCSLAAEAEPLTLKGHSEPVFSVGLRSTGKRIVSGGFDKTVNLWGELP